MPFNSLKKKNVQFEIINLLQFFQRMATSKPTK